MDDVVRRYLKQQVEIGGPELLLRQKEETGSAGADRDRQERMPEPRDRTPVEPASAKSKRDWRTGAPPIPGPGLVIQPPATDLLAPQAPSWDSLEAIARDIAGCHRCFLAQCRTRTVPGEGNPRAKLMLVGEGPGQTEDETGRPFVGRAGELLTEILAAIECPREEVYICNVVKCRPPQNRKPLPDEMTACSSYLQGQVSLIKPKVIVALGATAAEALLETKRSLADLRGRVHSYRGIPLVVTYHPAALLRNPNWKKPTWDDVRIARQLVDR